jgi:hypothetical protein
MPRYPDALELYVRTDLATLAPACDLALACAEAGGMGAVKGWAETTADTFGVATSEQIRAEAAAGRTSIGIWYSGGRKLNVGPKGGRGSPMSIRVFAFTRDDDEADTRALLPSFVETLRHLGRSSVVQSGLVHRVHGGAFVLPKPPFSDPADHAVLVRPDDIAAAYEDPAVYWSSWSVVEDHGALRFAARALDALSGAQLLREIQDRQWQLARAARPGRTKFFNVNLDPDERPIYLQGPARLTPTGYDAARSEAVYSTAVGPGEHIQGYEIDALNQLLIAQRLADGRPVLSARVIFSERAAALREKRPLLDVGAKVAYLDDSGALEELSE